MINLNEIDPVELEFLKHSNWIEAEYGDVALEDAIVAWEYFKKKDIEVESILVAHLLLMRRLNKKIAGKLRDCNVWIGGRKLEFISQGIIKDDLEFICEAINASITKGQLTTEVAEQVTKDLHIDFEHLHPFNDGNGRVGRMIMNAHRLKLGLPILVIHQGKEQYEYYKWFS